MNTELNTPAPATRPARFPWSMAIIAIVALTVLVVLIRPRESVNHLAVGKPAPELDLVELISDSQPDAAAETNETDQALVSLKGKPPARKVTVLHFWGTWCPPCMAEYPELVAMLNRKKSDENLQFVSVSCEAGPGETLAGIRSQTRRFYQKIDAGDLLTYVDAYGNTRRRVAEALDEQSMVYPTTLVIGPDQRIAGVWQGYSEASLAQMESMIDQLLSSAG
ncbi:MAG: TlpA family protein disulfide reductase [Planctomycetaceae bacterium]